MSGLVTDTTTATAILNLVGSTLTTAAGTIGLDLGGTINGNVLIDAGSKILTYGTGAQGILLTGDINACNQTVAPDCTSLGALINNGIIATAGTPTPGPNPTGNPTSGTALAIGGSIAGGIFNNGPISVDDSKNITAVIAAQSFAPVIEITPGFQTTVDPTPIVIGVYADATDPGFSFYNRGSIQAASSNIDQNTAAIFIVGDGPTATATLTGGLFNSGTHQRERDDGFKGNRRVERDGDHDRRGRLCRLRSHHRPRRYLSFRFGLQLYGLGRDRPQQAASPGPGRVGELQRIPVTARSSRPSQVRLSGNNAIAININALGTLPSIINQGVIEAIATSARHDDYRPVRDSNQGRSGTLTYIQNNGTIEAIATKLDDGSQSAVAIDLSLDNGRRRGKRR